MKDYIVINGFVHFDFVLDTSFYPKPKPIEGITIKVKFPNEK